MKRILISVLTALALVAVPVGGPAIAKKGVSFGKDQIHKNYTADRRGPNSPSRARPKKGILKTASRTNNANLNEGRRAAGRTVMSPGSTSGANAGPSRSGSPSRARGRNNAVTNGPATRNEKRSPTKTTQSRGGHAVASTSGLQKSPQSKPRQRSGTPRRQRSAEPRRQRPSGSRVASPEKLRTNTSRYSMDVNVPKPRKRDSSSNWSTQAQSGKMARK